MAKTATPRKKKKQSGNRQSSYEQRTRARFSIARIIVIFFALALVAGTALSTLSLLP